MSPRIRSVTALAGLALVAAACGGSGVDGPGESPQLRDGAVALALLDSVVQPGGGVRVEQRSLVPVSLGHNHCSRGVQRRDGDRWVNLPPEFRLCTAVLYELRPGETEVVTVDVPVDAAPGTYRFALTFSPLYGPGNPVTLPTPSFEVR